MKPLLLTLCWLGLLSMQAEELRIASYSPGATQTLIDLGHATEIVAATQWCPLPQNHPAARDCDVFQPDLERLLLKKPTLVILPRMANPLWATRCAKAGLRTVVLHPESAHSIAEDIALIGQHVGDGAAAKILAASLHSGPKAKLLRILVVWDGMMAGPASYLGGPLQRAGFVSALTQGTWIKFDWELLAAADPEIILWIQNSPAAKPAAPSERHLAEMRTIPSVRALACVQNRKVFELESGSNWLPGSGLSKISEQLKGLWAPPEK